VSLALTPSLIDNDYYGNAQLAISGLTNGETVLVQKFCVFNDTGTLDASAQLVQSLTLTDGQNALIGGITNFLAAADTTGVDGTIIAQLSFLDRFSSQIVGHYLYEVSSPGKRFDPITAPFTVREHVYPQGFVGTVTADGTPAPDAYVVLLDTANGTPVFVAGTVTDAGGQYHLSSVPGTYQIVALKQGWVGNMDVAGYPRLTANASLTVDLELNPPEHLISGSLVDAANPALGLAGVLVLLLSDSDDLIAGYADASGHFSVAVTADVWHLSVSSRLINQVGYVAPADPMDLDTSGGDATGVSLPLPRANALIYGQVMNSTGVPAASVDVGAFSLDEAYGGFATTDPNGQYVVAVNAGGQAAAWAVGAFQASSTDQDFLPADWGLAAPAADQAAAVDILIFPASANLAGVVTDPAGAPVPYLPLELEGTALTGAQAYTYGKTDQNGKFDVRVLAGAWTVRLDTYDAYYYLTQNYAATEALGVSVNDGQTVTNLALTAQKAPRKLRVTLQDSQGKKVSGISMVASASSDGRTFASAGVDVGDGQTVVPVFDGAWTLGLSTPNLVFNGYAFPVVQKLTVPAGGTNDVAITINLKTAPLRLFQTGPPTAGGGFNLLLTGMPGQIVTLQSSTDLAAWLPLSTIRFTNGVISYADPSAGNSRSRFYRAVLTTP
jgi:hypothetical protein